MPANRKGSTRTCLIATTALSPVVLLFFTAAAPAPASAQTAVQIPPVVVTQPASRAKPKQRASASRSRAARTQPSSERTAPTPISEQLPPPPPTATITYEDAFSRSLNTSDSASLVTDLPGGAVWGAGGVSSLPAFNGYGADRNQVTINGMLISPACPNQMNPPLSFVNPAMISSAKAYIGVAPVSVGGDYVGTRLDVVTAPPAFTGTSEFVTHGMVSGFYRSNGNGYGVDSIATMANRDTSITYTGGWARASDYKDANGLKIGSTLYEIQNHALSISKESFGNLFSFQVGGQFIPYQGFVNQYMDMTYNRGLYANGRYEGVFDWGKFEAKAYYNDIQHTMNFIPPDKSGDMPMFTHGKDAGYSLKATIVTSPNDLIRVGNEFYYNQLNDWWDPVAGMAPMMGPNVFTNINDGRRMRLGTFVEWERHWGPGWSTILGGRSDIVWMNTGDVQGYSDMYAVDAAAFNARDRAKTDANFDGSAVVRYEPNAGSTYELGFARKTRSPNLYERYAWSTGQMAMSMIGWFGDGNGYVGNIDLKPEKAHTVTFTAGWHDPTRKYWSVEVTPYYSYVQDYIDVDFLSDNMMSPGFVNLRFANHDAQLYGVNLAGKFMLWDNAAYGRGVFRGNLNYVRGERTDGINLYHMMPLNGKLALDHTMGGWINSIELQLVGGKTDVSQVHNELTTPAYALLNLRTGYQWQNVRLDFGVENVLNQQYYLPLGGANLTNFIDPMMGSPIYGYNVAGMGRSYNTRLTVQF
ncbi:MAG: TonB-dependent receptor [Bradyrhizobiaceae bacterium]|nr:MAG: TonB-dependent receptor [Bradyrhizobiaceae bacterium]